MLKIVLIIWLALFVVYSAEAGHRYYKVRAVYVKILKANNIRHAPVLRVSRSSESKAYSNGFRIVITTTMINRLRNNHEIALVLGHELAHSRLVHMGSSHANEFAADRLGAKYARRAGYNACKGAQFLKRMRHSTSKTHPSSRSRYKVLCLKR